VEIHESGQKTLIYIQFLTTEFHAASPGKGRTSLPDAKADSALSSAIRKVAPPNLCDLGAVSAAAAMACNRGACVWNHARLGRHFVMTAMNRSSAVKRAPRTQGAPACALMPRRRFSGQSLCAAAALARSEIERRRADRRPVAAGAVTRDARPGVSVPAITTRSQSLIAVSEADVELAREFVRLTSGQFTGGCLGLFSRPI
jgi:hypothetical protein